MATFFFCLFVFCYLPGMFLFVLMLVSDEIKDVRIPYSFKVTMIVLWPIYTIMIIMGMFTKNTFKKKV
ncbi:hypothetical protein phiOC_p333 [Ochrobactrum phage vB_OspM_OC]|nr:hypothetical protein phiOC_p333 [Ochrobactrum phage vB_OspM_OC]